MSKQTRILLILFVPLLLLALTGHKSIRVEQWVHAPREQVWSLLTQVQAYPDWNTIIRVESGRFEQDQTLHYQLSGNNQKTYPVKSRITQVQAPVMLRQAGGLPGVLSFEQSYQLIRGSGATRLVIEEHYYGLMVHFWSPQPLEQAYQQFLLALRSQSEQP